MSDHEVPGARTHAAATQRLPSPTPIQAPTQTDAPRVDGDRLAALIESHRRRLAQAGHAHLRATVLPMLAQLEAGELAPAEQGRLLARLAALFAVSAARDLPDGLPPALRQALEATSGIDLGDVRVHRDSARPAEVGALAYAQGTDIYLGPGQEHHLPHEAWHVVQQKQGRVSATMQMAGAAINADPGLEHEADAMGARAAASSGVETPAVLATGGAAGGAIQRVRNLALRTPVVVPIDHPGRRFEIVAVGPGSYDLLDLDSKAPLPEVAEWKVVPAHGERDEEGSSSSGARPTKRQNELFTEDSPGYSADRPQDFKTPRFVKATFPRPLPGKTVSAATDEFEDFDESAHLTVRCTPGDDHVTIALEVLCSPEYMCIRPDGEKKDLVPLFLATGSAEWADCIAVVEPTPAKNKVSLTATYDYKALLGLPALQTIRAQKQCPEATLRSNRDAKAWLEEHHPTFAVNAYWLAKTSSDVNSYNHRSGGVDQKGGSGLVVLKPPTLEDLAATERSPITDWNRGEEMHAGRRIYDAFPSIIQTGKEKELATTLEAESEFLVGGPEELLEIVRRLRALTATPACWDELAIENLEDKGQKVYTDTYYDVQRDDGEPGAHDHTLLNNHVVLRRRSVTTDKGGTFLFAVKGRDVHLDEETIRLAAQIQLDEAALQTEAGQRLFHDFLADVGVDNAFGRVLDDALEHAGAPSMAQLDQAGYHAAPVMTVQSTRYKFFFTLQGNTGIDFSADIAAGWRGTGPKPDEGVAQVCSFEFGVGHPGLTATNTGGGGSGGAGGDGDGGGKADLEKQARLGTRSVAEDTGGVSVASRGALFGTRSNAPKYARPYHVPRDLENKKLFDKSDYKQYQRLRDDVIDKVLALRKGRLAKGGNKSTVLAAQLGMIERQGSGKPEQSPPSQRARPQVGRPLPRTPLQPAYMPSPQAPLQQAEPRLQPSPTPRLLPPTPRLLPSTPLQHGAPSKAVDEPSRGDEPVATTGPGQRGPTHRPDEVIKDTALFVCLQTWRGPTELRVVRLKSDASNSAALPEAYQAMKKFRARADSAAGNPVSEEWEELGFPASSIAAVQLVSALSALL